LALAFDLPPFLYNALQKAVHGDYDLQRSEIEQFLDGRPGATLEVGCGTGLLSSFFAAGSYVGTDIDPVRVERARLDHPEHEFEVLDLTQAGQTDLERFDFVLCHACIHHIGDRGVHTIVENFREAARRRQRPVEFLVIEPVLPRHTLLNLPGFVLAKLDRGKFVRTVDRMRSLFEGTVVSVHMAETNWWPVPIVVMKLSVS
jgi:SAM-dependent methyltransferase